MDNNEHSTNLASLGTDCISRQAAIKKILGQPPEPHYPSWYAEQIKELPSAEPKRGKWISADAIFGGVPFYCSECGENTRDTVMGEPRWNYCPMCGAKMEVEHE